MFVSSSNAFELLREFVGFESANEKAVGQLQVLPSRLGAESEELPWRVGEKVPRGIGIDRFGHGILS
jgi:hypothetical protein